MADGNIAFLGFGVPRVGREATAASLLSDITKFLEDRVASKKLTSAEPFLLRSNGSDLIGFIVAKGDYDEIQNLLGNDDFDALCSRANLVFEKFMQVEGAVGQGFKLQLERFHAAFAAL